ncbi:putative transcriptional regulator [Rhizobium tibeticum]|nr:putative transcriptional regulator [Rhizobium tibeticum]
MSGHSHPRVPELIHRNESPPHKQNLDEPRWFTNNHSEPRKTGAMTAAFTVRVSDETASKLNQIAEKLDRSRAYMAAEAIEAFVEQQEWQLAEIEAGLAEADRGEFASAEDVAKVVGKYVKSTRQS